MSRTRRQIPGWINKHDEWVDGFVDKICRGHVSIPKKLDGFEVWGQRGKKFIKKLKTRKLRREGKRGVQAS